MCKLGHIWKKIASVVFAALFLAAGVACKEENKTSGELFVCMPDGAPALAMAKLLHEDTADDGVTYSVVAPAEIKTKVTYTDAAKNADLCVLPVTAASKLLGDGEKYVMLGAVTRGNLYLLARENTAYTAENLSSLVGKKVGVLQLNEVPGLTFKATLKKLGVAYHELTQGAEEKADAVNLLALTGADAIDVNSDVDCWLVAEPAASLQMSKKNLYRAGDLQALYGGGYTQAALVAKREVVEKKADWLKGFLADVKTGADWAKQAEAATIVAAVSAHLEDENYASTLKAPLLTAQAISHCGLGFVSAKDCAADTTALLEKLILVNGKATAIPADKFYCTTDFGV